MGVLARQVGGLPPGTAGANPAQNQIDAIIGRRPAQFVQAREQPQHDIGAIGNLHIAGMRNNPPGPLRFFAWDAEHAFWTNPGYFGFSL